MRRFLCFCLFISCGLSASYGQNIVDEIGDEKLREVLDFLISVNFSMEDDSKPKNSAFYYDEYGNYNVKASNRLSNINIIDRIISEVSRFSAYKLIAETKFERLDFIRLREEILLNCGSNYVNTINFDEDKKVFNLKVYRMLNNID